MCYARVRIFMYMYTFSKAIVDESGFRTGILAGVEKQTDYVRVYCCRVVGYAIYRLSEIASAESDITVSHRTKSDHDNHMTDHMALESDKVADHKIT